MLPLLQTLLVVAGITLWLYRAERLARDILLAQHLEQEKQAAAKKVTAEPIPADLLAQAQGYQQDWARQAATDHLYELYQRFGDWNQVRAAMAVREGTI